MSTNAATIKMPEANRERDGEIVFAPLESGGAVSWLEILRSAYESIIANRVRSFLTMLGVVIGVASVVTLMAVGAGSTRSITNQIQSIGTNILTIQNGFPGNQGPGRGSAGSQSLSINDVNAITDLQLPLNGVAPQLGTTAEVVSSVADQSATIVGTTPAYMGLNNLTLKSGSFFDDSQNKTGANVIVLGSSLAKTLFGNSDAVGQSVRIDGQPLLVIGVLASKGGGGFGSVDDQAIVPINYTYQHFQNVRTPDGNHYRVSSITISVTNASDISAVQGRLEALMREQHNLPTSGTKDDFQVRNQAEFLSTLSNVSNTLTIFLAAIAGISLLVGGIGIMNIMLVSVTERTKEIGLRKAIGARSKDILLQFLAESVALSVISGLIGVAVGVGLALGLNATGAATTSVSMTPVALALTFAVAVGLFFGIYPAQRASQLNPIDALRYE